MAETVSKFDKPIEVNFAPLGAREFRTAKSVADWADMESAFWSAVQTKIASQDPFGGRVRLDYMIRHATNLKQLASQYQAHQDPQQQASAKQAIKQAIQNALNEYEKPAYLLSESVEAQLINTLADENPNAAWVSIVAARHGFKGAPKQPEPLQVSDIRDIIGFLEGWDVYRANGIDARKAVQSQKSSLTSLRTRWEREFAAFNQTLHGQRDRIQLRKRRINRIAVDLLKQYRALQNAHKERMDNMEKAFSTEMQLRASEKFWSRKRRLNRKRARSAFIQFCLVGGLGLLVLGAVYYFLNDHFGLPTGLSVAHAVVYFIPTLAFVWLLRIIANEYKTNKSMADDAEEREAMVMTFKALEFERRVGDEERLVILNALFRSHGNGPEETVPAPVWEAIVGKISAKP